MNDENILLLDERQPFTVNAIGQCGPDPAWHTPRRTILDYEVVVVASGRLEYRIEGEPFILREGEVGLFPPHEVHEADAGQKALMYFFHFTVDAMPPLITAQQARIKIGRPAIRPSVKKPSHILQQTNMPYLLLLRRMTMGADRKEILSLLRMALQDMEHPACNSYQRIVACLRAVLFSLTRQAYESLEKGGLHSGCADGNWALVQKALFMIRGSYDKPLTVNDLAMQLHTTPQTLIRQFRICTGGTPLQALTEIRLEQAKSLMRDPVLSLKEIARAIGLRDVSEFSRWFRRQQGSAPRDYRKRQHAQKPAPSR